MTNIIHPKFQKLFSIVDTSNKATSELNIFVTGEFFNWFVENYPHLTFESVSINSTFMTFTLDRGVGLDFFAESCTTLLDYNIELSAYENSLGYVTIQINFDDPRIPDMVDIEGRFVLYPPEILEWLATNEQVNNDCLNGEWRQFGITRANQHIAQINQLIDYYKRKF